MSHLKSTEAAAVTLQRLFNNRPPIMPGVCNASFA
jgi:hypothetical protein